MPALIVSAVFIFVLIQISKFIVPLLWAIGCVGLLWLLKVFFDWMGAGSQKSQVFSSTNSVIPTYSKTSTTSMPSLNVSPTHSLSLETPTSGLVIDEPWISHILRGHKVWEMRSTSVSKRGPIALIRKGSGQVVGVANLVGCQGPLSDNEVTIYEPFHRVPASMIGKWRYAWKLENVRALSMPVSYRHPKGAVKWVTLDEATRNEIAKRL